MSVRTGLCPSGQRFTEGCVSGAIRARRASTQPVTFAVEFERATHGAAAQRTLELWGKGRRLFGRLCAWVVSVRRF